MRIGLVIYGSLDTLSGGYLYDRRLVEYLRSRGDDVQVLSLPWRSYAAHLTDNLWFRPPLDPGRTAKRNMFDILIQDELSHPSLLLANYGKHPVPIVSLVHHLRCSEQRPGWQNAFYRVVEKLYLNSVDGFIFNSGTTRDVVHGLLDGQKPYVVAYPPTDRFGPPLAEAEIVARAHRQEFRILFLGNLIARKGLHTLLEAVKDLNIDVRVDVVGSGDAEPAYARRIRDFISRHALSSFILLHGSLDQEPLAGILRQAHVLAVPSSYEGFGIVYLEGMGFGLPAIGTTAGAAGEVIEPGKTGFLIEPSDSRALAGHLLSLADDRSLLARLSLQARESYLRQPSWEQNAGSIRRFLTQLIQQPR